MHYKLYNINIILYAWDKLSNNIVKTININACTKPQVSKQEHVSIEHRVASRWTTKLCITTVTHSLNNLHLHIYYIPINVLPKIQAVPSGGIETSGSHFPYHHIVILRIRIMPVWHVNFNNMPKICRTTDCTKEDKRVDT